MAGMLMGLLLMGGVSLYGFRMLTSIHKLEDAFENTDVSKRILAKAVQAVQSESSFSFTALSPANSNLNACISKDGVYCPTGMNEMILYRKLDHMPTAEKLTGYYDKYGKICNDSNCRYRLTTNFRGRCHSEPPCDYAPSLIVSMELKVGGTTIFKHHIDRHFEVSDATDDTRVCEGEDLFVNTINVADPPDLWTCISTEPPPIKPSNVNLESCSPGEYLQKINLDGSFVCKSFGG